MIIEYLFSTSSGEFPVSNDQLSLPFRITPTQNHSILTLKDYFDAVRTFILQNNGKLLEKVLQETLGATSCFDNIWKIRIRSEKHGVLYHLSSVDIFSQGPPVKYSVSTAVSENGKKWLNHEFQVLNHLDQHLKPGYLPKPYYAGEIPCHSKGSKETLSMMLSEWFEDCHEWHFSKNPNSDGHKICIWDPHGNRFASQEQSFSILSQISRILTLYYEPETYRQIYPWHHAAGDFIVKTEKRRVAVKLTTARNYESFMEAFSTETANPVIAILYFFINLTIRIRLDRLDGIGEIYWAEDFSVLAAATGFFDAVNQMSMTGRLPADHGKDLLFLLKSFDLDELKKLFESLFVLYQKDDPKELALIRRNLNSHVSLLHRTLQGFSL